MPTARFQLYGERNAKHVVGFMIQRKKQKLNEKSHWRRRAVCKRAHNFYLDGLDTGCECQAYILFFEKSKGQHGQGRYFTHNSHLNIAWIPPAEEVVSICLWVGKHIIRILSSQRVVIGRPGVLVFMIWVLGSGGVSFKLLQRNIKFPIQYTLWERAG